MFLFYFYKLVKKKKPLSNPLICQPAANYFVVFFVVQKVTKILKLYFKESLERVDCFSGKSFSGSDIQFFGFV